MKFDRAGSGSGWWLDLLQSCYQKTLDKIWVGIVFFQVERKVRGCKMGEDRGIDNEPFDWSDVEFEKDEAWL